MKRQSGRPRSTANAKPPVGWRFRPSPSSTAFRRLFLPYGPGDPPQRLVPSALGALRAGKPVGTTRGRQQRDFTFAPDAADLLVRLLLSQEDSAFNIGTGCAAIALSTKTQQKRPFPEEIRKSD